MKKNEELNELGDLEKEGILNESITLSNIYKVKVGGFGKEGDNLRHICAI